MSSFGPISSAPISSLFEVGGVVYEEDLEETLTLNEEYLYPHIRNILLDDTLTLTQDAVVLQIYNKTIEDFLTLTQSYVPQTIYNLVSVTNLTLTDEAFAAQNYTVNIVDTLTIVDVLRNVYEEDLSDSLVLSDTEDGSVNSNITQVITVDQSITPVYAYVYNVPQTLTISQVAEGGLVFDFAICQQIIINQKVSQVHELDVNDSITFNLFEVEVTEQDLEIDQVLETNIVYTCLFPEGIYNSSDPTHQLLLAQSATVMAVYNMSVNQTMNINATVMRILV